MLLIKKKNKKETIVGKNQYLHNRIASLFLANIISMSHLRLTEQPRLRPSKSYHSFCNNIIKIIIINSRPYGFFFVLFHSLSQNMEWDFFLHYTQHTTTWLQYPQIFYFMKKMLIANKRKRKRVITMRKIGDFLHYHRIFSH
jgi:hypothetical protein